MKKEVSKINRNIEYEYEKHQNMSIYKGVHPDMVFKKNIQKQEQNGVDVKGHIQNLRNIVSGSKHN